MISRHEVSLMSDPAFELFVCGILQEMTELAAGWETFQIVHKDYRETIASPVRGQVWQVWNLGFCVDLGHCRSVLHTRLCFKHVDLVWFIGMLCPHS